MKLTRKGDYHYHENMPIYNFDPLKSHFYIVKLGFTGVYIIFLISAVLTSIHNLCFEQKYEKYQNFLSENFPFLVVKFSKYLNRKGFRNDDGQLPSRGAEWKKEMSNKQWQDLITPLH